MGLFGKKAIDQPVAQRRNPRDIEALEEFVANLESATDEASTWRIFASTYVEFYDMEYGAAWVIEKGVPRIEFEVGRIAGALAGTADRAGLVQQAVRNREAVYSDRDSDARLTAAHRAGAVAAIAMPVVQH